MFENTPCKHPVVVLKDIKCSDIEALLSYMYAGVVSVLQQDLARLIKAAELLQIKGLAVPDEPPVKETKKNSYPWSSRDDRSSPHPKRRRREDSTASIPVVVQPSESPPTSPHNQDSNKNWEQSKPHSEDQRGDDGVDQRPNEQTDHTIDYNTKQELPQSQDQSEETLVKEEIVEATEDNHGEVLDSRIEYGAIGSSEGGDEQSNKFSHHLDPKHPQPLHEAVVEALAGPSGMQGWLGTGELGGGFSMLEGYSEDTSQEVHGGTGAHGSQQSHQMVGLNSDRSRNMRKEANTKLHQCPFCAYSSDRKDSMTRHIRSHTGEKPYTCSHCTYSATTKDKLIQHMRTHTGEKPYACPFCPLRFALKNNLNNHIRVHTGEKPYVCPLCSYRSAQRTTLVAHIRRHQNI
ncbi:hypothetical protein Pmani_005630 [Petrolisthes manimaculis]|uniref:C2H2-type domain-containing protein n=1 Tax=Petrolisthes manimaculis TaxID=1843537 RepID=A0AAE1QBW4_9EUCA|nr:hypothetical protein Pmani_005630 [Petrolisthes manimaculis]